MSAMACKVIATIVGVISMITNLASARRVQTEMLIHHPIHANDQPLDDKASSLISRFQIETAAGSALEKDATKDLAKSEMAHTGKAEGEENTLWKSLFSGGFLTSLSLAISSHALGHNAFSTYATTWHLFFCSLAIFLVASFAYACRVMAPKSMKSKSCNRRNQYVHRSRVVYEWIQTPSTITFFTKLPTGQTQDSLEVKLWPKHARIGRKDKVPFLREALYDTVDVEKCYWSVSKGELVITLAKKIDQTWPCVFEAHHPNKVLKKLPEQ
jgi:hypothetical protein